MLMKRPHAIGFGNFNKYILKGWFLVKDLMVNVAQYAIKGPTKRNFDVVDFGTIESYFVVDLL
jgi:hypothetical protein